MNILVVAAHPDDEVLGLGGTLLKHTAAGDKVFILILTDGHSSRNAHILDEKALAEIEARKQACIKCADILGASDVRFYSFDDQRLDTYPLIELVQAIEKYARTVDPDIVYIHHSGDVNKDHKVMFEASITAFRPVTGKNIRLLAYETFSSSEWGLPVEKVSFLPNVYYDITDFLDKKIEAVKCYAMELREYPHPRSVEGIRIAAQYRGAVIARPAAEGFVLLREIS